MLAALRNPNRFILSPGEQLDHKQAEALLGEDKPLAVVAAKGYDNRAFAQLIADRDAEVVIFSGANNSNPRRINHNLYKDHKKIERLFNRIKHYCRMATRYHKTAASFLAFLHLAAAITLHL